VVWVQILAGRLSAAAVPAWRIGLQCAGWLAAISAGYLAWVQIRKDYIDRYANLPELNLLDRSVAWETVPGPAFEFLHRNKLDVHLLTNWTWAGPAFFYAPGVKVFIDGRAQQVFSIELYRLYRAFAAPDPRMRKKPIEVAEESGTNAVLVGTDQHGAIISQQLQESRRWVVTLTGTNYRLLLAKSSPWFRRILELERAGAAWWPPAPESELARGYLWGGLPPADYARSLDHLRAAVERKLILGIDAYPMIGEAFLRLDQREEGLAYFRAQRQRINDPAVSLDPELRKNLIQIVESCLRQIRPRPASRPASQPDQP
jgi:hypothetical protein